MVGVVSGSAQTRKMLQRRRDAGLGQSADIGKPDLGNDFRVGGNRPARDVAVAVEDAGAMVGAEIQHRREINGHPDGGCFLTGLLSRSDPQFAAASQIAVTRLMP